MREASPSGTKKSRSGVLQLRQERIMPGSQRVYAKAILLLVVVCLSGGPWLAAQSGRDRVAIPGMGKTITLAEALRATLEHHPTLSIQQLQVTAGQALKQQATGQFDTVFASTLSRESTTTPLSSYAQTQLPVGVLAGNWYQSITPYGVNVAKQFRNGISMSVSSNINRTMDNLTNPLGLNTSQTGVQFVVPLKQGRGREVVDAKEQAASIEVVAREYDLRRTAESLLATTADSYWNLVAARDNLAVAVDSEKRSKAMLDTVKALIEADQRPRNDIYEVKAEFASRVADRIAAEQVLGQSRKQLALDMGLPATEILTVGDPKDGFPAVSAATKALDGEVLEEYFDTALQNRSDVMAARERTIENKVLLHAAEKMTKPQLNLQLSSGYEQLSEGAALNKFVGSLFTTLHRPDAEIGFAFQFPMGNNLAQGQRLEVQANSRQAELQFAQVQRTVTTSVAVATESVQDTVLRLQNTHEAVEALQLTLEGMREKYRLGETSLTELLTVEDRLTTALSSNVSAELAYATALSDLRLATGTLLDSGNTIACDAHVFVTLPGWSQ
jgi:outer membrane protein TolC